MCLHIEDGTHQTLLRHLRVSLGCVIDRVDLKESLAAEVNRPGGLDRILMPLPFGNVSLFLRRIQGYESPEKHFFLSVRGK